jgi:signal transduction histidine kinase
MRLRFTLSRKIALGFLVAPLALIIIGFSAYRSVREYSEASDVVAQTYRVLSRLNSALQHLATAESEARGYAITGDEQQRANYRAAAESLADDIERLKDLALDGRVLDLIAELEQRAGARINRLDVLLDARQQGGLAAVAAVAGPGRELMDEVREVAAEIEARERELLVGRNLRAQSQGRRTLFVVLFGSVFAVGTAIAGAALLTRELARRERLERRVIETREREQQRIGQDLHDGVCQQLTGVSLMARGVQQRLAARAAPEADALAEITRLVNDSIEQARQVTRGLRPVPEEPGGLMVALRELAEGVARTGQMACQFECPAPVPVPDPLAAEHLFRIAQEAVQNAMRHAAPKLIRIRLAGDEDAIRLTVSDDGRGMDVDVASEGLGLSTMRYRARALGAKFAVSLVAGGGTIITCVVPRSSLN